MTRSKPWLKFFTSDWRSEITLRRVSREARSLWIDLLCLIHEGGDGRLHFDGQNPTDREIASILGDDPRTVRRLLKELENAKVFSRNEDNFIISRRVLRDLDKAEIDRKNGKTGGNPSLINNDLGEEGVNPPVNAHIPEARGQSLDKEKEEDPTADAVPSKYAFEGRTIKLTKQHFDQWQLANSNLSLRSELYALDEWAGQQKSSGKNWFAAVAGALAKKQRDFNERIELAKAKREAPSAPKRREGRI